jgi:hypothetical protein
VSGGAAPLAGVHRRVPLRTRARCCGRRRHCAPPPPRPPLRPLGTRSHREPLWRARAPPPRPPPDTILQAAKGVELFLDLTLAAFLLVAIIVTHSMIKEKMAAKREAAAKGAGKRAPAWEGGAATAAPAPAPDDSPERRMTAKASMRARRRMA